MNSPKGHPLKRLLHWLHCCEDALLVLMLLSMIVIAFTQIILRNFFDGGLVWADPLVRVLVIWIALAGAMVAGRKNSHIAIDVLTPWLKGPLLRLTRGVSALFTTTVCALMFYYSLDFVASERLDGAIAFAGIPVWLCESIIPIAFAVLSLRFMLSFLITMTAAAPLPSSDHPREPNGA